jgi:hypothetical protein
MFLRYKQYWAGKGGERQAPNFKLFSFYFNIYSGLVFSMILQTLIEPWYLNLKNFRHLLLLDEFMELLVMAANVLPFKKVLTGKVQVYWSRK